MGDVAQSSSDFGYVTVRNYFETSHAKGPQDGAGANLKHKADMAVIKRQVCVHPKLHFTFAHNIWIYSSSACRCLGLNIC